MAWGVGVQRETTLVWDKHTGEPLHKAVVWLDTRTSELCQALEAQFGSKVRPSTAVLYVHVCRRCTSMCAAGVQRVFTDQV